MNKQQAWNTLKIILKVAVTAGLLVYVFQKIDLLTLRKLILQSDPIFIFLAFIIYGASLFVASWRSQGLLKSIGLDLEYWYYFKLYMLGTFYNVTLPGGVGGDGYKIYILRKKFQLPTKKLFLAMLFDRLSGLWAIGFITVSLIIFIPKIDVPETAPVLLLLGGTATYYLVMRKFFRSYSERFVTIHFKAGILQSLQVMVVICLLLSQHFNGKFSPYLFSFQLSTLAANIPASIGGAGVRETTMIKAAGYFGMDLHLAIYLSISFYLITTLVALAGVFFMYYSNDFEKAPSQHEATVFEDEADKRAESSS